MGIFARNTIEFPIAFTKSIGYRSETSQKSKTHAFIPCKSRTVTCAGLVEVVGVEPTSYSAAKKLSTYLVYLLFLNSSTRVNTL